ncbi:MAG: TonB-dependent receptor [Bacteroidales bacterium]|nr:TonB-dependent receptor [Bacteroidales bacterium]
MKNLKTICLLVFLLLVSWPSQGQKGILKGRIIDAETGKELIGATIVVEGTILGTNSDLNGNYSLKLDPGSYDMRFSYVSYQTQLLENVLIEPGKVKVLNLALQEIKIDIREVKVMGRLNRKSEAALQVMQKKSASVFDGISASEMARMNISNAADALKRVSGISVEGGKYIYVRGLSDRYSITTLNGAVIPGADPERNTVQMDLFPSNIIKALAVYKTFSPELPGNFTGGYINIITRDFPDKFNLQFSASAGYNPKSNLNASFLNYPGGRLDALGLDDGTRAIPETACGQIPSRFQDDARLTNITRSFNKIMEPRPEQSSLNQSYSLGLGNSTRIRKIPFGYNIGISWGKKYEYYDDGITGRYKLIDGNDRELTAQLLLDTDEKGSEHARWSVLGSGNFKISNHHTMGILLLHNQYGTSIARYQEGIKHSDDNEMHYQTRTLQYLQRGFTSVQLKGEHYFKQLGNMNISWFTSTTYSSQYEPDLRFFTNHYTIAPDGSRKYEITQSLYPVPTRYYRNMNGISFDNNLKIKLPLKIIGEESYIKAGFDYIRKKRSFREHKFMFNENSNTYAGDISCYLDDNNMDAASGGIYVTNSINSDHQNSYDGRQYIFSAFFLGDISPISDLRLVGGIRMEKSHIVTKSLIPALAEGYLDNTDLLPSLNIIWHITCGMNLRLAGSRTLALPTFRELAPYSSFNFVGDYVFVGNATLKRTLCDNTDLRWEYFFKPGEMITVSTFYKLFHNPIERTFNTEAANPELTLRNVELAKVAGIELEFRKKLDFSALLKDFLAGGNISLIRSSVSIDHKELLLKREFDPDFPNTRSMTGQAPWLINAFLGYRNKKIGFEANISYHVTGKRLFLVNAAGIPDIHIHRHNLLDANISKSLGKKFRLRLAAENLLNDPALIVYPYKGNSYIYQRYTLNRTWTLGLKYKID